MACNILFSQNLKTIMLIGFSGLFLTACSTTQNEQIYAGNIQIDDRFEGYNRAVFGFNNALDNTVLEPVAKGYRAIAPQPVRTGARNFFRNLRAPLQIANQLLQGDLEGAGNDVLRTVINTLVGVGGLFDVAGYEGIEFEPEDFGQTLAVWGVDHGPYVVLPFMGSSSMRDYTGFAVDAVADPWPYYFKSVEKESLTYYRMGSELLIRREELLDILDDLESSSVDYYAAVRSSYYQHRDALVNDQDSDQAASFDIPDFDDF